MSSAGALLVLLLWLRLALLSLIERPRGDQVYREAFLRGIQPDPKITVTEWAEAHRILSPMGSNEAGPYRVSRTPYWREPMDVLSVHCSVERCTIMKAAQLGATEFGNNWIGYIIDICPAPTMFVAPTEKLCAKISRQRLDPMFADSAVLRGKIHATKARDSSSSLLLKTFPGGMLALVGANAPTGFRSMPARFLMRDEVDDYPGDVGNEGDPLLLSERATTTYPDNRKILDISTPTVEGRSRIDTEFKRGDQRYYHVPCPHCATHQRLEWTNLKFDRTLPPKEAGEGAAFACVECGGVIEEHHKTKMLAGGIWIPERPERSDYHRSYHISAFYSPWKKWAAIVERFLNAKGKPAELKTWVNHDLGETWKEKGEAPEWEVLYRRRESYPVGKVPVGGLVLTMGVDVQKDRIEAEVVAWGAPNEGESLGESWSVEYFILPGSPNESAVWADLSDLVRRSFPREGGADLRISRVAVDSGGHWTQNVYRWGRKQSVRQVMIIKGSGRMSVVLQPPRVVDVKVKGKRLRRGIKLWMIGVGLVKEDLYGRLHIESPLNDGDPFPGGFCHFPEYPDTFFQQLTAERLVPEVIRGYRVYKWKLPMGQANEALDCRVYAMAAAESIGIPRMTTERWNTLRNEVGAAPVGTTGGRKKTKRKGRRRGGGKGFERWHSR